MSFNILVMNIAILLSLIAQSAYSESPLYFLCASDEDGCFEGQEQYCACIPINTEHKNQPYCLDSDEMACKRLSERAKCDINMITFPNQESCIATLFQSESYPPCKIVTQSFCNSHPVYMCNENGDFNSCIKTEN